MKFKIDGETREISDEVIKAIENADIGDYRSPQEWGVEGLTWHDEDTPLYFTIFNNRIFVWTQFIDWDEPETAEKYAKWLIEELKKKGIDKEVDDLDSEEIQAGQVTVDLWFKTGKRFEELTPKDLEKPLKIANQLRKIIEGL